MIKNPNYSRYTESQWVMIIGNEWPITSNETWQLNSIKNIQSMYNNSLCRNQYKTVCFELIIKQYSINQMLKFSFNHIQQHKQREWKSISALQHSGAVAWTTIRRLWETRFMKYGSNEMQESHPESQKHPVLKIVSQYLKRKHKQLNWLKHVSQA